jgi:cyclopropane fatty-acyl-phospholipid synthase-like methyltransferase
MSINKNFYDADYFERGISAKKSCYINYDWMPELTIPMASKIINYLKIRENSNLLDFGCSKGYLVKAFRLLDVKAFGVDISSYAIENLDNKVKKFCKIINSNKINPFKINFEWTISKDVLEHLTTKQISDFLRTYYSTSKKMFHVIPLGDKKKFRIKEYHLDKSHLQMQDEVWWEKIFLKNGWKIENFDYKVKGIKDNWFDAHPKGNGFFTLVKA